MECEKNEYLKAQDHISKNAKFVGLEPLGIPSKNAGQPWKKRNKNSRLII